MVTQQNSQASVISRRRARPAGDDSRPQTGVGRNSAFRPLVTVLVAGLMLWFEALLMWASPDGSGLIAPSVAVLGTCGLFLHLRLLTKPFGFRLFLGVLGVLFFVRLVAFPPHVIDRGFFVVPQAPTVMLAEFFLGCQCLLLWRWRWHDPLPIAIPCVALITSILALNVTIPIGMMSTYVVLVTLALLLPTALVVTKPAASPTGHKKVPWNARFVVLLVWASACWEPGG